MLQKSLSAVMLVEKGVKVLSLSGKYMDMVTYKEIILLEIKYMLYMISLLIYITKYVNIIINQKDTYSNTRVFPKVISHFI